MTGKGGAGGRKQVFTGVPVVVLLLVPRWTVRTFLPKGIQWKKIRIRILVSNNNNP